MRLLILALCFLVVQAAIAQDSPHGDISIKCAVCHSPESWSIRTDSAFDHATTGFPLTGQHRQAACVSCHENLVFAKQDERCASCHTDVHKEELGNNCMRCHSTTSWNIADMRERHQETRFPLQGKHAITVCESCHSRPSPNRFAGTPLQCITCHQAEYTATTAPPHAANGFGTDCTPCHKVNALDWPGGFDHATTGFPLLGAHLTVPCASCHANNQFRQLPTDCFSCHQSDFQATQNPSHVSANFSHNCTQCHTMSGWTPASFDHSATGFPLTGAHRSQQCQSCHTNGNYQLTYQNCYQCHQNDYQGTTNPNHAARNFSHDCQGCHSTASWSGATIDHNTTNFPLTGAHVSVACGTCHTNNNYNLVYTDCYQCHQAQYQSVTDPNHVAANFSHDCSNCHNTTRWSGGTFNHATTQFALTGAHTSLDCASCHTNQNYQLSYSDCYQCHQSSYQSVTNPNHVAQGYPHTCQNCHSTSSWSGASFDHNTTRFALTGAHTTTQCASCHTNSNYNLVYSDCYQCHQTQYQGVTDPNHAAANFSHDCSGCHSTTAWTGGSFSHPTAPFQLTGAHISLQCGLCHVNQNYNLTYTDCYQCHQAQYQSVTNPNHVSLGYPHTCQNCHSTTAWTGAAFDHNTTHFPLTGVHTTTLCASCHVNNNYSLVYTDCYQCHQAQYQSVTDPNHVAANFSHDCSGCHTTTAWTGGTFNHAATGFTLTGAHVALVCGTCHVNQNFSLTYTDCYQCHQTQYQGVVDPSHVAANFSHDCSGCHTTTVWTGGTFNHSATKFALTGAHVPLACAQCHVSQNYQLSYTSCYMCHAADYAATTNPIHSAASFPTTCDNCHTTTSWAGATFNHTWFPITHGATNGVCSKCHSNPSNYAVFQCTDCHTQAATDPHHTAVTGYVYNSANCYACHPRGVH